MDTVYTDVVRMELLVTLDKEKKLQEEIIEATNGKSQIEYLGSVYFAVYQGEVILFDEIKEE